MSTVSRRGFLKGVAAAAGAAAGARIAGPFVRTAAAATETSHLVHIIFPGGYNGLFGGCADKFIGNTDFGVTSSNVKNVGSGVFTDAATLGTLPLFALDHWAAIGTRHGVTSHLSNGAEKALLFDGTNSYLNQLAYAMGGSSSLKSVQFGDRMPYGPQPSFNGVSLQRVTDLGSVIKQLGDAQTPDPTIPDRMLASAALAASRDMSGSQFANNAASLTSASDSYKAAIDTLATPAPPTPPVTFADIQAAYGLSGTAVNSFSAMMAGAEVMIRAAGSNVINVTDLGFVLWDFHQVSGGRSLNGDYSRTKFSRSFNGGGGPIIAALKTFCSRMLNLPGKNVVVALSGDFVRLPTGDHGDGTMVTVMGKYVKQGVSFPIDGNARFAPGSPGSKQLWSYLAAALKVQGTPFGANPHAALVT